MTTSVSPESIKQIFTEARTHHAWLDKEVADELLSKIFDVAKWGPTSVNSLPARFLFLKSSAAKSALLPALAGSNVQQVQAAPVTAVIAFDEKFYDELPTLFTAFDAKALFLGNPTLSAETAFRNSALQGAYFMLAARALGLDVGPMSGFDSAKVDEIFFSGTSWKSNFLCNIGYGDPAKLFPRGPRLSFDQAAKIA
jgi:3-hydroxypropanoate dehydrogenase